MNENTAVRQCVPNEQTSYGADGDRGLSLIK